MKKNIIKFILGLLIAILMLNNYSQANVNKFVKIAAKQNTVVDQEEQQKKSNNFLKFLSINNYEMYPEFNKNTFKYYVSIPTTENSLEINAEAEIEDAKIRITGNDNLRNIENQIRIVVTAKNGLTKTYTIYATKQKDNQLKLDNLQVDEESFNPEFSKDKYFYNIEVEQDEIKPLNITAEPNDLSAKVEVVGNDNLEEGDNLISILVSKGTETTVYQINANISMKPKTIIETTTKATTNFNDEFNKIKDKVLHFFEDENRTIIFLLVVSAILLILIILLIIKIVKKSKAEKNRKIIKKRAQ